MTYMEDSHTKIIPPTHPDNNAIFDSRTTAYFNQATSIWMNQKLTKYPLSVTLPDVSWIKLTHTATLYLQNLPESARHEHIFTELNSRSLLSVSQLFDQVCMLKFTADQVIVTLNKKPSS